MREKLNRRIRPEDVEERGDIELSAEQEARVEAAIAQAESELEQQRRVSMRWPAESLAVIQRVAEVMGVPYQTYIKQVAFRAAIDDLAKAQQAMGGTIRSRIDGLVAGLQNKKADDVMVALDRLLQEITREPDSAQKQTQARKEPA